MKREWGEGQEVFKILNELFNKRRPIIWKKILNESNKRLSLSHVVMFLFCCDQLICLFFHPKLKILRNIDKMEITSKQTKI